MYEQLPPRHNVIGVAARVQYGPVGLAVAGRHMSGSLPFTLAVSVKTFVYKNFYMDGVRAV